MSRRVSLARNSREARMHRFSDTCTNWPARLRILRLKLRVFSIPGAPTIRGPVNMRWKILISCHRSPIKFRDLDSSNCTIKISYWAPFNYKPRLIVHLSVVCDSRTPVGQGVGRAASRQTRSWANPPSTTTTPNIATRSANLCKTLKTRSLLPWCFQHDEISGRREEKSEGRGSVVVVRGVGGQKREKARTQKTRPFVNQSKQGFNLMLWLRALCFADGLKMSMWWVLWEWCLPRSSTRWALQAAAARLGMSVHSRSSVAQAQARARRRGQHYSRAVPVLGAFSSVLAEEHFWSCFSKMATLLVQHGPTLSIALSFAFSDSSAHKCRVRMLYIYTHTHHSQWCLSKQAWDFCRRFKMIRFWPQLPKHAFQTRLVCLVYLP